MWKKKRVGRHSPKKQDRVSPVLRRRAFKKSRYSENDLLKKVTILNMLS